MILGFFYILKQFTFTRIDKNLVTMYVLDNLLWLGIMGNGMLIMQGMRGMFTWIPGNLLDDSAECYHLNIPRNVREDTG